MKKSNAALRKPPAPVEAADQFVAGGLDVQTSKRPANAPGKAVVERADGRQLKRMTVYLPTDLAKQLGVHCVQTDEDMSAVVTAAVEQYLRGK